MISVSTLIYLCFAHYIADFVCQTDWMAVNKSKFNVPLLAHVCTYSCVLFLLLLVLEPSFKTLLLFIFINATLHFIIDFFTSRLSSHLKSVNKLGSSSIPNFGFFSVIGFDQFLHYTCLFITYSELLAK